MLNCVFRMVCWHCWWCSPLHFQVCNSSILVWSCYKSHMGNFCSNWCRYKASFWKDFGSRTGDFIATSCYWPSDTRCLAESLSAIIKSWYFFFPLLESYFSSFNHCFSWSPLVNEQWAIEHHYFEELNFAKSIGYVPGSYCGWTKSCRTKRMVGTC